MVRQFVIVSIVLAVATFAGGGSLVSADSEPNAAVSTNTRVLDPIDANCDGSVGAGDALFILRVVAGLTTAKAPCSPDVDGVAGVTPADARYVLQGIANLLPPPTTPVTRKGTWFMDGAYLHVVGEVANPTNTALEFVRVTATMYSAEGTLVGTQDGYAAMNVMTPGSDSPYRLIDLSPPPNIDSVRVTVTGSSISADPIPQFTIVESNSFTNPAGTTYSVIGEVTNTSALTYQYVNPVVAFYDAQGFVVRIDDTFTQPSTLAPVATGSFQITDYAPGPVGTANTRRYWVTALAGGTPPDPSATIIRHTSTYTSGSTMRFLGEVANQTAGPLLFVEITARFRDANGTLLAVSNAFSDVFTIVAGNDSPFEGILVDPPSGITSVSYQVTDYSTNLVYPVVSGLDAVVSNAFVASGTLHIMGTVTNNSATAWTSIEVFALTYNQDGSASREGFTFSDPSTLGPGQSAPFDVLVFSPPPGSDTAPRRLWVDARP